MISFHGPRFTLASLPFLAALAACGPAAVTDTASSGAAQDVAVAVSPGSVQVAPGGKVGFSAVVTGAADSSVEWLVASPSSGTVDASGVYTAPTAAGTYTVTAQSKAKGNAWGKATVTVTPTP
ncbi:MAG TPA: Ig-like domain-containing protein, partial [Anaeromyxobacteraceae bacterium]|nr:Ig-like domain-containing protein [Anaeromyxobacteraceae bacterium]